MRTAILTGVLLLRVTPTPILAQGPDRPSLYAAVLAERLPSGIGDTGRVRVVFSATRPHQNAHLAVTFGGSLQPRPADGFTIDTTAPPLVGGVPGTTQLRRSIVLVDSTQQSASLLFDAAGAGPGYVIARLDPGGGPSDNEGVGALYFLLTPSTVYSSDRGTEDVQAAALTDSLLQAGVPAEQVARRVRAFRRRAATVRATVTLPAPPPEEAGTHGPSATRAPTASPALTVLVRGSVRFTDAVGVQHPVRFAPVEVYEDRSGGDDRVATAETDANGQYGLTLVQPSGGTTIDLYVVARATNELVTNELVAVVDLAGMVYEISSEETRGGGACPGPGCDVPDGATLTVDLVAGNEATSPNDVAFSAFEAVNTIARYLPSLGEPLAGVTVRYPENSGDGSWYDPVGEIIQLAKYDALDWDNIHHEYGHFLQHVYGILLPPSGSYATDVNHCTSSLGRSDGLRVSWGEAWPTFFAISGQQQINRQRVAAGLPRITVQDFDDVWYDDRKQNPADNFAYRIEQGGADGEGEGNTRAVLRALWDFYDDVDDAGDAGVALGALEVWNLVTTAKPTRFSTFWSALVTGRTEAEKAALGAILAVQKIGPMPTAPVAGTVATAGAIPVVQWAGNMSCAPNGDEQYSMRVYDAALTMLIYASPFQAGTSFDLSPVAATVFAGPDGPLTWVVVARDPTYPPSGYCTGTDECAYYGQARGIVDNISVTTRAPVDIILALDFSGSMGTAVPGTATGLTKLELLKQAVQLFVDTWVMHAIPGDRLGVVYFNSTTATTAIVPPFLGDVTAQGGAVVADLLARMAGGCTALGGALQVAYDNFDPASTNKRVILLFSDGIQTANPFLTEAGTPPMLRVNTVAPDAPAPLGGFHCTDVPATAPDGSAIGLDGLFLYEHGIQVHSIGVGVSGAAFSELIERIASETDGLHHFTSAPDEELDLFFTNDLVSSLQTGTLQIVATDRGRLEPAASRETMVPVNRSVKLLSLVLSWRPTASGGAQPDTVGMTVIMPNGTAAIATRVRRGPFYAISQFEFASLGPQEGNWRVRVLRPSGSPGILYQLTALVDEPCLDLDFGFRRQRYRVGDPVRLTAAITHAGEPWRGASVSVEVAAPVFSARNLLAERFPNLPPWQAQRLPEPAAPWFAAAEAAAADTTLSGALRATRLTQLTLFDDGTAEHGDRIAADGIYTAIFRGVRVPGRYAFRYSVVGSSACGAISRTEMTAMLASPGPPSPERSRLTAYALTDRLYLVRALIADGFGDLFGPGGDVDLGPASGRKVGPVSDRLDGSYQQVVVAPGPETMINVIAGGHLLARPTLADLMRSAAGELADALIVRAADPRSVAPGARVELPLLGRGFRHRPQVAFVEDGVSVDEVVIRNDEALTVRVRVARDAPPGTYRMVVAVNGRGVVLHALTVLPMR